MSIQKEEMDTVVIVIEEEKIIIKAITIVNHRHYIIHNVDTIILL